MAVCRLCGNLRSHRVRLRRPDPALLERLQPPLERLCTAAAGLQRQQAALQPLLGPACGRCGRQRRAHGSGGRGPDCTGGSCSLCRVVTSAALGPELLQALTGLSREVGSPLVLGLLLAAEALHCVGELDEALLHLCLALLHCLHAGLNAPAGQEGELVRLAQIGSMLHLLCGHHGKQPRLHGLQLPASPGHSRRLVTLGRAACGLQGSGRGGAAGPRQRAEATGAACIRHGGRRHSPNRWTGHSHQPESTGCPDRPGGQGAEGGGCVLSFGHQGLA
mmetsp:Transcript_65819/g.182379  ORF Transcript_65819/g.182379 Transcript_65819/m.182379 type:complete len:277 (-) Transcript_65819:1-831(-)